MDNKSRDGIDLPLDGDAGAPFASECVRATGNNTVTSGRQIIFSGGQVAPTVIEMTNPIRVWSVVLYGQSGKPGSPHATDQMKLFSDRQMRPTWHDWASLEKHIESTELLEYVASVEY